MHRPVFVLQQGPMFGHGMGEQDVPSPRYVDGTVGGVGFVLHRFARAIVHPPVGSQHAPALAHGVTEHVAPSVKTEPVPQSGLCRDTSEHVPFVQQAPAWPEKVATCWATMSQVEPAPSHDPPAAMHVV